jgi:hypothetical protein
MTLLELFGRDKARLIRARTKLKARRMNPKEPDPEQKMATSSRHAQDPSTNIGGGDHGTGLLS